MSSGARLVNGRSSVDSPFLWSRPSILHKSSPRGGDNVPDNDSESGEEQYLRWVDEVSGASSDGGNMSSDAGDPAAATAAPLTTPGPEK